MKAKDIDLNHLEFALKEMRYHSEEITSILKCVQRLGELEDIEKQNCAGCVWKSKRHQKCSCCKRNYDLKDNYESALKSLESD